MTKTGMIMLRFPYKVIPAPHEIRDKLQPESNLFKHLQMHWTAVFTGVTNSCDTVQFGICDFVHCYLFDIWDLYIGIY